MIRYFLFLWRNGRESGKPHGKSRLSPGHNQHYVRQRIPFPDSLRRLWQKTREDITDRLDHLRRKMSGRMPDLEQDMIGWTPETELSAGNFLREGRAAGYI